MRNVVIKFLTFFLLFSDISFADATEGYFSGRISSFQVEAGLLKIKADFPNIKYVNKKDVVEFWNQQANLRRCRSYVAGRTSDYILLKIPNPYECSKSVSLDRGVYLNFFSQDLVNNLKMGKEVVEILLKKRLALKSKLSHVQRDLDSHIEKVNAVNSRYEVLRQKLLLEWKKEIQSLEEDRVNSMRNYKGIEIRLDEVSHKLEKYRVEDENLKADRWSLDPRLYYKK
ncbi:hypothetical protein HBN50_05030 [Halobacteriovorax sp. GB3]|uniref:hypothetical protein n=1 Tax=Halobacteriovorax sp. GB3 TaxID=2719615 RepID=UPI0023623145|nr:hypothetical protein [Halobacteriovorax sp. GB3]MDD0852448.1 hypothetical protein [Halobacteriovorax sp. GB3]